MAKQDSHGYVAFGDFQFCSPIKHDFYHYFDGNLMELCGTRLIKV